MGAYAARFDAALVPPERLAAVVADACAIEKMAATVCALAAARTAGGGGGPAQVALNVQRAADALAKASGTSVGEARKAIEAARAMAEVPQVGAAARAGELSRAQASLVAGAAQANPGATERLLDVAGNGSLAELVSEAAKVRAGVQDLEQRRRSINAARSLRSWADEAGVWHLHAQGLAEHGAKVMAAIGCFADEAFATARKDGRRQGPAAYAFDGLVALAGSGERRRPGYEVMVRVDFDCLVRGYALDGETCEVTGFGTVTPQVVADIIATEDPFLKTVVTKGKDVVGVAHLGRVPNAYQRSALDWLYPACAVQGCPTRAQFLQSDHRAEWSRTHYTVLDLLDRLCPRHHRQKTTEGWALVKGTGKRAFVGPTDPRHPGPCPAPTYPGAPPPGTASKTRAGTATAPPPVRASTGTAPPRAGASTSTAPPRAGTGTGTARTGNAPPPDGASTTTALPRPGGRATAPPSSG
jgi:hypothetical protein